MFGSPEPEDGGPEFGEADIFFLVGYALIAWAVAASLGLALLLT